MSSEAKTGIVVIFVIAVGVIAWSKLGGLARAKGEYTVIVCFEDVLGLPVGAPVRLHGVKIGEVTELELGLPAFGDEEVDVYLESDDHLSRKFAFATLAIDKKETLYAGDVFQIASGSLVGDKHVRVSQGVRRRTELNKDKLSILAGSGPAGIDALQQHAEELATQAKGAMANLDRLIGDEQMRADLKATLANMRVLSLRATQVAEKALVLVDSLGPEEANKVQAMVDNLYEVSNSVRRTAAGINAMVSTTTIPEDIEELSDNLIKAGEHVERSTAAVEELIADPRTSDDIRTTLGNVREASETGVEIAEKTSAVLDKVDSITTRVDNAMGGVAGMGERIRNIEIEGQIDARLGSGPAGRIDIDVDIYPNRYRDDFWRIGMRDVGGDEERLDFQRGIPLGHRGERLRVGIFDGELGAGWDREWSSRLASEIELIDPDAFRVDVKGRYRYTQDWDLIFGFDRALSGTEPYIGARRYFDF